MLFGIALEGTASIWYFMSGSGLHFCSASNDDALGLRPLDEPFRR
jgi:hypothetical protein